MDLRRVLVVSLLAACGGGSDGVVDGVPGDAELARPDAHADAPPPPLDARPTPSGEAMPGDVPGWRQVFADDFLVDVELGDFPAAVSDKWGAYDDGWSDTSNNGTYFPSKVVSIAGGLLDMYIHTEEGVHLVSAPVPELPTMLYGRYAIRFRADPVPGYKTAWLLWPDSGVWPRDGEIDFPEGNLDGTIHGFMHRQDATVGNDQDAFSTEATYPTWHTAVIEWTAGRCELFLDGVSLGSATARIPNTPMHWVIQTETRLGGGPPADDAAGHVQIDWVVAWAPE